VGQSPRGVEATGRQSLWRDFSSPRGSRLSSVDLLSRHLSTGAPGRASTSGRPAEPRHEAAKLELGGFRSEWWRLAWRWETGSAGLEAPGSIAVWQEFLGPAARTGVLTRAAACSGSDKDRVAGFWSWLRRWRGWVGLGRLLRGEERARAFWGQLQRAGGVGLGSCLAWLLRP